MSGNALGIEAAIRLHGRLRHRKDFDAIFRRGRSWNNEYLVLRTLPNALSHSRTGFIISKRVGNAVVRNRVRRRLKEAIRTLTLREGWDIVFSVKTSAPGATFHQLKSAVVGLLTRSELLGRGGEGASS